MLDLKTLVSDPQSVINSLSKRGVSEAKTIVESIVEKDVSRKAFIQEVETLKQKRNEASEKIGALKKEKKDASEILSSMKTVSTKIKEIDEKLSELLVSLKQEMLQVPNVLDGSVPEGKDESSNRVEREWGSKPTFEFKPLAHHEIGEKLGILDFKRAGQVTGARFSFLRGKAAELELALARFMIALHKGNGYEVMVPPYIINSASLEGTGQFPKFKEDVFHLEETDYYLSPTAEVPVTNYFSGEILSASDLPTSFVAYSPCFRSEAGSYGKDTKGLKRQHQFNKVELVKFVRPEDSEQELEKLVTDAESVLKALGLAYRVVTLCAGDTSFSAKKTYDIEVWSPYSGTFMEISSCSNFGDFQARRANIRYRDDATKKTNFVHTLNGSGLAVGRTLIALMENYQTSNGDFEIPAVLQPFL